MSDVLLAWLRGSWDVCPGTSPESVVWHDGGVGDKHGIYTPAEQRDIELKVNPGGGAGDRAGGKIRESCAEYGKLQSPCGELLRGECVAQRGGKRRVGLLITRGKKRFDGRGIEGGASPVQPRQVVNRRMEATGAWRGIISPEKSTMVCGGQDI